MPLPPSAPAACRHCRQPLGALARLGEGFCHRAACRLAGGRERAREAREAELARRSRLAARRWPEPGLEGAPVYWIEDHATRLVPLPATRRRAHREHLDTLAALLAQAPAAARAAPGPVAPPPTGDDMPTTPLAGALCAFCAGRCCRPGASRHAFVDAALLRRWLAAHPGRTAADAAAAYAAQLPRRHVEGSCVYHGREGCALPREMRSDICNGFACDALRALQASAPAPTLALAASERRFTLGDAARLAADGPRRLPR